MNMRQLLLPHLTHLLCCLVFNQVWRRCPGALDYNPLWPVVLPAINPMTQRLGMEVAAEKVPALLEAVLALATAPGLVRVLGDLATVQIEQATDGDEAMEKEPGAVVPAVPAALAAVTDVLQDWQEGEDVPAWAASKQGWQLLGSVIGALGSPACGDASRRAILDVLEALLQLEDPLLLQRVLLPWTERLLVSLRAVIVAAMESNASGGRGAAAGAAKVSWVG